MRKNYSLSEHQMAIMRVLWKRGEATVADVHQALQRRRELALTTVATMLTRLEKRALVSHRTEGRQYYYKPEISEKEVRKSMVKDLIRRLFDNDPAELVSHLVRESEINEDDLEEIQQLIRESEEREKDG